MINQISFLPFLQTGLRIFLCSALFEHHQYCTSSKSFPDMNCVFTSLQKHFSMTLALKGTGGTLLWNLKTGDAMWGGNQLSHLIKNTAEVWSEWPSCGRLTVIPFHRKCYISLLLLWKDTPRILNTHYYCPLLVANYVLFWKWVQESIQPKLWNCSQGTREWNWVFTSINF